MLMEDWMLGIKNNGKRRRMQKLMRQKERRTEEGKRSSDAAHDKVQRVRYVNTRLNSLDHFTKKRKGFL
ncbi:hypothetical protein MLD52_08995 [Puniceicoccaceae bacterium K14]|nr:hypothetical protein [Puniceicoccaceae bacterium K14]